MPLPTFTPKNQYTIRDCMLAGMSFPQLVRVLWNNRQYVDFGAFWFKISLLVLRSLVLTIFAFIQWVLFSSKVKNTKVNDSPVFVLGHFRSGTTLVQYILTKDTDQFIFPTTLDVGCTSATLLQPAIVHVFGSTSVTKKRPMDNMDAGLHMPQEDDIALVSLQGGESPRSLVIFPRKREEALKPLTLVDTAKPGGFQDTLLYFYKMIHAKYGSDKRILSKSPEHTARVKTLLSMFPKAQFVFIKRNPYRIYRSMVKLVDAMNWSHFVSTPTKDELYSLLFDRFPVFMDAYFEAKDQIPKGNLVEVAFEDFQNNMMGEVERIYKELGWDLENARPRIQMYVESLNSFSKNSFASISSEERALVNKHWGKYFAMLGYDMIEDDVDVDISNM